MANNLIMYGGGGDYTSLYNSGFTTCIINSFHIRPTGIIWNNTPVLDSTGNPTSEMSSLQSIVAGLQDNNIEVLLSIGGGGAFPANQYINAVHSVSDVDFLSLSSLYFGSQPMDGILSSNNAALAMLSALMSGSGATGIDLDVEPYFFSYTTFASTMTIVAEWAQAQGLSVTWVPYMNQPGWAVYADLLSLDNASLPNWVNVQPPAWSDGPSLQAWAELGSPIVAGLNTTQNGNTIPLSQIQNQLAGAVNGGAQPAGAYIWNLAPSLPFSTADYVSALNAGLAGETTAK